MKNIRLQYAGWHDLPADVQSLIVEWQAGEPDRGRGFYEQYFYWFNIAHEIGHILRAFHGTQDESHYSDETAVNQFAAAYWRARGDTQRLTALARLVLNAISNSSDPLPPGETRSDYFDGHYEELTSNPSAYGHYQFSMVQSALAEKTDFQQVLRTLITPEAREITSPPAASLYHEVNPELPARIVDDMRDYLAAYNVELPEVQIVREFSPKIQFVDWD